MTARKQETSGLSERKSRYAAPRAGRDPTRPSLPGPETLPDGTVRYFLPVGAKGRVLLPVDMRRAMGLEEGEVVTAWLKDGEVRMHSHRQGLRDIQTDARSLPASSIYASDELIAERRAENARDEQDARPGQSLTRKKRG